MYNLFNKQSNSILQVYNLIMHSTFLNKHVYTCAVILLMITVRKFFWISKIVSKDNKISNQHLVYSVIAKDIKITENMFIH